MGFLLISVFTIFDSNGNFDPESIATLGSNVLYLQNGHGKWETITPGGSITSVLKLHWATCGKFRKSTLTEATAFMIQVSKTVKFRSNYVEGVGILGVSRDFDKVWKSNCQKDGTFAFRIQQRKECGNNWCRHCNKSFQEANPVGQKIKFSAGISKL